MPKVNKKSKSTSKAAKPEVLPKGEKLTGLKPAIPFCEPKVDEDAEPDRISIKISIDDTIADKNSKTNVETKSFNLIESFSMKGLEVLKVRCALDNDIFMPKGLTGPEHVDKRLNYFRRCLTGRAVNVFGDVFAECKNKMLLGYDLDKAASEYSDSEFFEFIKEDEVLTDEDKKGKTKREIARMEESLLSGKAACTEFERRIWFELGKKMWQGHRSVFHEHSKYLKTAIRKPYDMSIMDYVERVREMWYLRRYLPPPSLKNQAFSEAQWSELDEPLNEVQVRTSIRDGLPDGMQAELDAKDDDYRQVKEERFNEYLINIESMDIRKREAMKRARENLKVATSQARDTDDLSAESRIPRKKKPKKSYNKTGAGLARVCMHCKNAGMPANKYGSHATDQCRDKDVMIRKASGSLGARKEVSDRYKKKYKEQKRELKRAQKRNAKLYKAAKRHMDKKEFNKMAKKLAAKKKSAESVDSSSDDDSSISSVSSSDSE